METFRAMKPSRETV